MFICETCEDVTLVAATVRGIPDTIPCPKCHWLIEQEYTLDGEPLDLEDFLRVNIEEDSLTREQVDEIKALKNGQEMTLRSPEDGFHEFCLKRIL